MEGLNRLWNIRKVGYIPPVWLFWAYPTEPDIRAGQGINCMFNISFEMYSTLFGLSQLIPKKEIESQ